MKEKEREFPTKNKGTRADGCDLHGFSIMTRK